MAPRPNRRLDEVRDLRAMAHPLRVRLYYALQALEAATATRLAGSVGESPALVSYHLRQLRDHGFVEEADDLGTDRRERWWRPATEGFRFSLDDLADHPERRGAAVSLQRTALANQLEKLEAFRDEQVGWGTAWSEAAFSSDLLLRLTPGELETMHEELQAVLRRWREHGRRADARDAGSQAPGPPVAGSQVAGSQVAGAQGDGAQGDGSKAGAEPADEVGEDAAPPSAEQREHVFCFTHAFPFRP